jgi:hypothetical protein
MTFLTFYLLLVLIGAIFCFVATWCDYLRTGYLTVNDIITAVILPFVPIFNIAIPIAAIGIFLQRKGVLDRVVFGRNLSDALILIFIVLGWTGMLLGKTFAAALAFAFAGFCIYAARVFTKIDEEEAHRKDSCCPNNAGSI